VPDFGFEELEHTADWAMRVRGPDLTTLFLFAAKGMNALAGMTLTPGPRVQRILEIEAPDAESLLVAFLSELVYYIEQEHLGFDHFDLQLRDNSLQVMMVGAPIESIDKAIKAVTYHNLKIRQIDNGLEVEIVFDV
jgi:protein archease